MHTKVDYVEAAQKYRKGDYIGALTVLNQLIDTRKDAKTYALMARTFIRLDMKSDAAASFELAAKAGGPHQKEHQREAMLLYFECGDDDAALLAARSFITKARSDVDVAYVLASIFLKRGQKSSLDALRHPLLESNNPKHLSLAMRLLSESPADEENFKTIKNILARKPRDHGLRLLYLIHAREVCDFNEIRKHQPMIVDQIRSGNEDIIARDSAFYNLTWCQDERLNQKARMNTTAVPTLRETRRTMAHEWNETKIRIGYLSQDFWPDHATMKLLGNVLEQHNSDRFDVTLFCHTPAEKINLSEDERRKWGKVVRILDKSDVEAAKIIKDEKIDILVDLKGHTSGNRVALLNLACAPIQVSWLGFPGTTANVDSDYVIGDHIVLPDTSKPYYYEKFVRLPETYQPNNPSSRPRLSPLSRDQVGLPEEKFVFASFNANRKISLEVIEAWGQILNGSKKSVIWMLCLNPTIQSNLLREFERMGISRDRVIFTTRVSYAEHINRIQLADLGLDTWPYNGHTTTSEQLWAGLPVLAKKGTHFASRVSESLLRAIRVPELVADDIESYVQTAIDLSTDTQRIAGYRARLTANRFVAPLFDSERFCRHLEKSYEMMCDRSRNNLRPDHIDVPALPLRIKAFNN